MTADFSWIDKALRIETDLAEQILTDFLRDGIQRHGFERAVVGVSGGIDSAVACSLSARALGPENVLALRMPYRTSSPESLDHAGLLIDQLGVASDTIDISPMVDGYLDTVGEIDNVRQGNVMARSRMIVLYDQSAAFGGLVVGTGNKTELLLGYTTLFGDSACALNPNGDLYKAQLRQLAASLDIPKPIRDKPPSADLWKGQTDEDELGFTYQQVDRLLYLLVDERYTPEACVQAGFKQSFVDQVTDRVQRTQYKRVPAPIAKLSNRTIGHDFLYLRDWGT